MEKAASMVSLTFRSLSEMEPSGVSLEVTKSCTNKDHCQSAVCRGYARSHKHNKLLIQMSGTAFSRLRRLVVACRHT